MKGKDKLIEIREKKKEWEENVLMPASKRFGMEKRPTKFHTPLDIEDFDFERDVGFPGQYPFTPATYPVNLVPRIEKGAKPGGLRRAGTYSGYGTPEDTRDYYKLMAKLKYTGGPNLALDLPTQCGYDSDNEMVEGEVGKVGVAIDTLRDFEVIFEAFTGEQDLDKIATNITINSGANILVAMYIALAEKRGIRIAKLRGTPQNDILKEFVSRGTYIFPPRPSMRMFRDSLVFFTENLPGINITSIGGYHIREGGATREQELAFSMAIGIAYLQEGVNAGVDIDAFAPKFTFNGFGGSMEFFKEIAFHRASRRMWARILKEKFGAKKKESMRIRCPSTVNIGLSNTTKQRALNNLTRSVVGGIAAVLSGGSPMVFPPYDEPLGLGWSLEARQLAEDATRILMYETGMCDVIDPLAGSYYIESLTNEIEAAAWKEMNKIEEMGGAVTAIETGYMQRESAKSAAERQARIERREDLIVGVNCFIEEYELDVTTSKIVEHPYSEEKRYEAEKRQKANLAEVKRTRNNREVKRLLLELEKAAKEEENLMPLFINLAKEYASLQEQCDVLRNVFGEWQLDTFV